VWHDGDVYIVSGLGTRKSRNLAENPASTISVHLEGLDLVLEGEGQRVTDAATIETLAAVYRELGWPAEVDDDAFTAPFSAPSAGPPPWHLYRFTFHTVFAVAGAEPPGAMRWRSRAEAGSQAAALTSASRAAAVTSAASSGPSTGDIGIARCVRAASSVPGSSRLGPPHATIAGCRWVGTR
jgi:hypothetical protein